MERFVPFSIYICVDSDGCAYGETAAHNKRLCIHRAEGCFCATWADLEAAGYRVAIGRVTIEQVSDSESPTVCGDCGAPLDSDERPAGFAAGAVGIHCAH